MRLKLLLLLFLSFTFFCFSQAIRLSSDAIISVITIGPGNSLNDAFGHNAFRISDKNQGIDVVYGYGEYDFDAPNFYLKFAQGKLNYLISRHNFSDFYNHYAYYNRTIEEQVLNLTSDEKQNLFNYLENNYKPENRRYLYDFFYDNCATRIRDVANTAIKNDVKFVLPDNFEPKTFRKLIHEHVNLNSWGSLGIDVALGSVIDKRATAEEHMFLPKYIHAFFEVSKRNDSELLVKSSTILYNKREEDSSTNFLLSPLMVLGTLALIILFITYKDYKRKQRSKWLDVLLFCSTGTIGIAILLLWIATDHSATAQNYNLLWAFPLNIFIIGQIFKNQMKNWVKGYLKFLIIMLCLMTFHWIIGIQLFAIGLIPILLALFIRYLYLIKTFD